MPKFASLEKGCLKDQNLGCNPGSEFCWEELIKVCFASRVSNQNGAERVEYGNGLGGAE